MVTTNGAGAAVRLTVGLTVGSAVAVAVAAAVAAGVSVGVTAVVAIELTVGEAGAVVIADPSPPTESSVAVDPGALGALPALVAPELAPIAESTIKDATTPALVPTFPRRDKPRHHPAALVPIPGDDAIGSHSA